jgi:cysteine desulfurase
MDRSYFDHNATTPVAPEVLAAMLPCFAEVYGNASSIHHYGQQAKARLEQARRQVAELLGCRPNEVVFTSGGTEANNLAILGTVRAATREKKHVITSALEHPSVLDTCRSLEKEGVAVTYVRPGSSGVVAVEDVRAALRPETVLITVMHANNELGTVQPIREIAAIAREAGVAVHTDGVQSTGKIPLVVAELGVDFFSLSGHKIYGPKGVGALYVRRGSRLRPILYGGHHERDRRPGTENVPGAVGLGAAAELARRQLATEMPRLAALRDRLESGLVARLDAVRVNGGGAPRVPNTTNVCFDFVEGESMVIALDLRGVAVSTGSACSSGSVEPSHVLTAIGLSPDRAKSSLRFSLGKQNTAAQVDSLLEAIAAVVDHLRALSPCLPRS